MLWKLRNSIAQLLVNPRRKDVARINIVGDRDIEWGWIASRIPSGAGLALDFGNGGSMLGLIAALRGYDVTAIDRNPVKWPYSLDGLCFEQCDIADFKNKGRAYDLIINCSVIEHVGLSGRYNATTSNIEGDLLAMRKLRELLQPGGLMLLTLPVGRDHVYMPLHRIYGEQRLPKLLKGFQIEEECYWLKDDQNKWIVADKTVALAAKTDAGSAVAANNLYGLGCFVIKRVRL